MSLPCPGCRGATSPPASVDTVRCDKCDTTYGFPTCHQCKKTNQVPMEVPRHGWICEFCRTRNKERDGRLTIVPARTAGRRYQELARRGMLLGAHDVVLIGGFAVVGSSGLDLLPVAAVVSLLTRPDALYVRVEIGGASSLTIPYLTLPSPRSTSRAPRQGPGAGS
jgi:hypothetical protein